MVPASTSRVYHDGLGSPMTCMPGGTGHRPTLVYLGPMTRRSSPILSPKVHPGGESTDNLDPATEASSSTRNRWIPARSSVARVGGSTASHDPGSVHPGRRLTLTEMMPCCSSQTGRMPAVMALTASARQYSDSSWSSAATLARATTRSDRKRASRRMISVGQSDAIGSCDRRGEMGPTQEFAQWLVGLGAGNRVSIASRGERSMARSSNRSSAWSPYSPRSASRSSCRSRAVRGLERSS